MSYVQNYFVKILFFKNLSIKPLLALFLLNSNLNNLLRSIVFSFLPKTFVFNLNKYFFKYIVIFLLIFKKIKKIYNKSLNNQLLELSLLKSSKNKTCIKQNHQISFFIFNKNYIFIYIMFFFKKLFNPSSINLAQYLFFQTWNIFTLFLNYKDTSLIRIFTLV